MGQKKDKEPETGEQLVGGWVWVWVCVCVCPEELFAGKFQCHRNDAKCSVSRCRRREERSLYPASKGGNYGVLSHLSQQHVPPALVVDALEPLAGSSTDVPPPAVVALQLKIVMNLKQC